MRKTLFRVPASQASARTHCQKASVYSHCTFFACTSSQFLQKCIWFSFERFGILDKESIRTGKKLDELHSWAIDSVNKYIMDESPSYTRRQRISITWYIKTPRDT